MKVCNYCRVPFDEVHPLDFMNDWTCQEMHSDYSVAPRYGLGELAPMSAYYGLGFRPCKQPHTWREHVQQSYRNRGQFWFNQHFPIEVEP
jgi:hypothetical protein